MTDDAFHALNLFFSCKVVGIIVDSRFDKHQVGRSVLQHILFHAESMRRRTSRGQSGFDKGELSIGETLLQVFPDLSAPTSHLCDGTAQESYASFLLDIEFMEGIIQIVPYLDMYFVGISRLIPLDEIDHRFRILQTVRMMVAVRFDNHFDDTSGFPIFVGHRLQILFVWNDFIHSSANGHDRNFPSYEFIYQMNDIPLEVLSYFLIFQVPFL